MTGYISINQLIWRNMFVKQERSIYNTGAMKLFGKKNCYVLMHKDIPVLKADYSEVQHEFKDVMYDMNEAIFTELPKQGLSFPFPQMDIHMK